MPVKNAAVYLTEALRSIAQQHWQDYELVVVDDGSNDHTVDIVRWHADSDSRIRLFLRPAEGIVAALNFGLEQCRAPLIARMDGDDVMHPARLGSQYEVFARTPNLTLCATDVNLFPAQATGEGMHEYIAWQHSLTTSAAIDANIFWEAPFVHPAVMFDRDAVVSAGGYENGTFPEDYELWLRLHARGARFVRLQTPLLSWRQHAGSLSRTDSRYSQSGFDAVRVRYLGNHLRRRGVDEVVVWGAGRRTRKRASALASQNVHIKAWIDIDPRKVGKTLNGRPVYPPDWLDGRDAMVLVYVRAHGARALIARQLEQKGFCAGRTYWPVG